MTVSEFLKHNFKHFNVEAMRRIENVMLEEWQNADRTGESFFPHDFFY